MSKMPVIFISHGSPLMVLDADKRRDFQQWSEAMPTPHAILVISAHWETPDLALGTVATRELIYDFGGFPPELYRIQYAAPGASQLAERVSALFQENIGRETRQTDRGWDHGVWTPLVHMYPDADVPILQTGLPREATPGQLFDLGNALAPLRDAGVLIIGSGQITHNLSALGAADAPVVDWARTFDDWCKETLDARDWDRLRDYPGSAPELRMNHPTEEHFRPLLMVAGAASTALDVVQYPIAGFEYGSLSRRSIQFS